MLGPCGGSEPCGAAVVRDGAGLKYLKSTVGSESDGVSKKDMLPLKGI